MKAFCQHNRHDTLCLIFFLTLLHNSIGFQTLRLATQPRHTSKIGASCRDQLDSSVYEDALLELESEALYGLGCKQSDLADFAGKLERGTLNLFPEYQRSYVRVPVSTLCSVLFAPAWSNQLMSVFPSWLPKCRSGNHQGHPVSLRLFCATASCLHWSYMKNQREYLMWWMENNDSQLCWDFI